MDIILLERVGNLGTIGDVVTVKDGFARNFLLPNKKALRANKANKALFEANRERLEKENEERRAAAATEGDKLDGMTIELIRQASQTGQLYGSVAVRDIVAELEAKGEPVTKKQVVLERPIKAIGMYEVRIALHAEVDATIKVNVARSPEEAERQAEGIDVIAEMFEKEQAEIAVAEIGAADEEEAETAETEVAEGAEEDASDEAGEETSEDAEETASYDAEEATEESGSDEENGEEKA
ncbi:50S ribosomal protein L9 [Parasphingopyxis algicola]|uniref:50S ribosomal protein L9 n=1 Tax=Parasphingopyxis algicola TaxID=2026624 RepID=UPI0015A0A4F8|nr:50S ribosomal protein L9 [Parasphingopyxis algicola]QLC23794.1 50S ribosomal protein L9 [Parasphingopyxis algicola]